MAINPTGSIRRISAVLPIERLGLLAVVIFGDVGRMKREIHIISYFSRETDLASEMRGWPEFVSGQEYSVDLKGTGTGETVSVRFIQNGDERYVSVSGGGSGTLFDRVLGRVIYALAAHSDNLMIDRCT